MNDTEKLALTCGDPAGVGPEIIARWLAENPQEAERVVAVGPRRWLETLPCAGAAVGADDFEIAPGRPSAEGHRVALAAMERAAAGTLSGEFSGVVTAPVNKAGLKSVGYAFPGQTEFFAARWGGVPVMAFAGGRLSVVLATWHIPLKDVPAALTAETLERAVGAADFLARRFSRAAETAEAADGAFPRIGLCGLNPHAGEGGILGSEEIERIEPAASRLSRPGARAAQDAGVRRSRQHFARADVCADVAGSRHRLRHRRERRRSVPQLLERRARRASLDLRKSHFRRRDA